MAILDLPTDRDLVARNQRRADELKREMGKQYLCHPANRVQRLHHHVNMAQIGGVCFQPKGSK